jgi:N-acetylmuramoyl-L-alanine amidase
MFGCPPGRTVVLLEIGGVYRRRKAVCHLSLMATADHLPESAIMSRRGRFGRRIQLLIAAGLLTGACTSSGSSGDAVPTSVTTLATVTSGFSPTAPAPSTLTPTPTVVTVVPTTSPPPGTAPLSTAPATTPANNRITIALNPGHNGGNENAAAAINRPVPSGFGQTRACDTTGTNTDAGYTEHAFNWDVSLRVRALLVAHGIAVVMTRDSDTGVGPCIDRRAAIANAAGIAAVISIHADGAPADGHGFHICYDSRPPAGAAIATQSYRLTQVLHDALVRGSGFTTSTYLGHDGYFARDDLAGLNLATVPATFIELGNMRNAGDAAIQSSSGGRARIAAAIAAGILAWVGAR